MMNSKHRGGTFLGIILGMLVGLAAALAVAIYVAKVPIPFVNKNTSRTSGQDAAEAEKNRDWDPNSPLRNRNAARPGAPTADAATSVTGAAPAGSAVAMLPGVCGAATGAEPVLRATGAARLARTSMMAAARVPAVAVPLLLSGVSRVFVVRPAMEAPLPNGAVLPRVSATGKEMVVTSSAGR